jgi:hypothetical protein
VQLGLDMALYEHADAAVDNAIARVTGGNFQLDQRLFAQIERIVTINKRPTATAEVVTLARERVVEARRYGRHRHRLGVIDCVWVERPVSQSDPALLRGENRGVDAIASSQVRQDLLDIALDGQLAQVRAGADLTVRQSLSHQL